MDITCTVGRGRNLGTTLTPHRHKNGKFVVSPSKRPADYIYCDTVREAWELMRKHRLSLKMSSAVSPAPSLISFESVQVL